MIYDIKFSYINLDGKKITEPLEFEAKDAVDAERKLFEDWAAWKKEGETLTDWTIKRKEVKGNE